MDPNSIVLAWSLITFLLGGATISSAFLAQLSKVLAEEDKRWKIAVAFAVIIAFFLSATTIASIAFGFLPAFMKSL